MYKLISCFSYDPGNHVKLGSLPFDFRVLISDFETLYELESGHNLEKPIAFDMKSTFGAALLWLKE